MRYRVKGIEAKMYRVVSSFCSHFAVTFPSFCLQNERSEKSEENEKKSDQRQDRQKLIYCYNEFI